MGGWGGQYLFAGAVIASIVTIHFVGTHDLKNVVQVTGAWIGLTLLWPLAAIGWGIMRLGNPKQ